MTNTYAEPVAQLLKLGRPEGVEWLDYSTLDITRDHIPELIRLVEDHELRFIEPPDDLPDDEDLPEWFAQIHAWRALGQLKAEEAIPAILGILHQIDGDDYDDWISEDAEEVFALIGPAAIRPLAEYLANDENGLYARVAAASSLRKMGLTHLETRGECLRFLVSVVEKYAENDEGLNGFLIHELVQLRAVEHIALIEEAFAAKKVDEFIMGDFEDVQVELGLIEQRARPRARLIDRLLQTDEMVEQKSQPQKNTKKDKNKRKQAKKSRKKNRKRK